MNLILFIKFLAKIFSCVNNDTYTISIFYQNWIYKLFNIFYETKVGFLNPENQSALKIEIWLELRKIFSVGGINKNFEVLLQTKKKVHLKIMS